MKFSRVGDHTIKCIITEEEIDELGFSVDEILSNGARTQEFMNHVFDKAEQEFQMKFDLGIKTVRADFLPDHTISLTFSEHPVNGIAEHLKEMVNGFLDSIPAEKWESLKKQAQELGKKEEEPEMKVAIRFSSMEDLGCFAKQVPFEPLPDATLFKQKNQYYLVVEMADCSAKDVKRLTALAEEYATDHGLGEERMAHVAEHGKCVIAQGAIQKLRELYA